MVERRNDSKKDLWELIEEEYSEGFSTHDFRKLGGFNERLGSWGPIIENSRYFKSLLLEFAKYLDNKSLSEFNYGLNEFLSKIQNQDKGSPTNITYKGSSINIDYLLSAEEILFLHKELSEVHTIMEIGPGFGRLPHSILQQFQNIENYFIIDLDFMLPFQQEYLKEVLKESEYKKIEFLPPKDISNIPNIDITINIDSFQEIKPEIVKDYLNFISSKSKYFFCKNAVCKYHPSSVDIKEYNQEQYEAVLEMGLCRDVVDIYDDQKLKIAKENYVQKYCPKNMKTIKSQDCFGQYNYYYSVLYSS